MTMYPICRCGAVLGLDECELGDENLCMDEEMKELERMEVENMEETSLLDLLPKNGSTTWYKDGSTYVGPRCVHALDSYGLVTGETVYLSGSMTRWKFQEWEPDIGFYLDGSWDHETLSFAYLVAWKDYGLPNVPDHVFDRFISVCLDHVRRGEKVEIGCMGSHGRTGTFVACLEIAASGGKLAPKSAIARVRTNHCEHAIESTEQEWYVRAFHARLNGKPIPKKPKQKVKKNKTSPVKEVEIVNPYKKVDPTTGKETDQKPNETYSEWKQRRLREITCAEADKRTEATKLENKDGEK